METKKILVDYVKEPGVADIIMNYTYQMEVLEHSKKFKPCLVNICKKGIINKEYKKYIRSPNMNVELLRIEDFLKVYWFNNNNGKILNKISHIKEIFLKDEKRKQVYCSYYKEYNWMDL